MKIERTSRLDPATGIGFADTPQALSLIHKPDCAAVLWRRQPTPCFQAWLDALPPEQLPRTRTVLRPSDVRVKLEQVCDGQGTPEGPERDTLIDDAAALADIFAGLMGVTWVRLRLEAISTNACRRFHVDMLTARLICTYRGTGTQIGVSSDGAEPKQITTVATGAPIVLRGADWGTGHTLLHRSPPIEGSGEVRLVLVLDPVADPEQVQ
ncbi:DUF1826 domain-containing protein [Meridianimarinicoccus aquatilis]|uniref:DUF1826 domain-containing protein n=1 Tax=Meridianimarinicoccus aquatilis TaxID=2552766 RepID=A0A4V3BC07_9RHOB|nr:DUF1826 domain-containing protein [Fluviibacterium aquatile]TDL89029.1 DUF1826 domain-containing protein [Fluviibacterium aquatile]